MKTTAQHLRQYVTGVHETLLLLDAEETVAKLKADAWSPKEVIGHLIDSASVNHERIVRACRKNDLCFEPYDQDAWVSDQLYHNRDWTDLLLLWKTLNLHIADVMERIPDAIALRETKAHNFHRILFNALSAEASVNLLLLCKEYVAHLQHHIDSILEGPG